MNKKITENRIENHNSKPYLTIKDLILMSMSSSIKEKIKTQTRETLKEANYDVSEEVRLYPKTFDYVAKKDDLKLLLKTLVDINNLRKALARRLIDVSSLLLSTPFLIGKKNHGAEMEKGVIYERHGIKSMTPQTLRNILVEEVPPLVYAAPGGKFANLNGEKLKKERVSQGYSRGELASKIGVSRSTIRKYEEGKNVSIDKAIKLEETLNAPLFESINLSYAKKKQDYVGHKINDPILSLLSSIGFDVSPTERAPFKALSEAEAQKFLTGIENYNKRLRKKAVLISSVSGVVDYKSFMVIREKEESKKSRIKNTPLLTEEELCEEDSLDDVLTLIKERA